MNIVKYTFHSKPPSNKNKPGPFFSNPTQGASGHVEARSIEVVDQKSRRTQ